LTTVQTAALGQTLHSTERIFVLRQKLASFLT